MSLAKKPLVAFVIFLLFPTAIISPALAVQSAPKAKCIRVGQTATVKATSFRCTKVKGKLTWIQIRNYAPQPTQPSPQPTQPSPQPTQSADPILERVSLALDAQVLNANLDQVDDTKIGSIVAEPGIDLGNIKETIRILRQIYLAQDIYRLQQPPVVILATSIKFIQSEFPKYCGQRIDWFPNDFTTMEKWEQWAFVGCLDTRAVQVVPMPTQGLAIDHIEGAIGSDLGYLPIGLGPNTAKLPTWFVRGLKGVVAEYAVSIGESKWKIGKMGLGNCISVELKDISYSYTDVTSNRCDTPLGQTASRYLVSLKGLRPTLNFIIELQKTGVWSEEIFAQFIGMPFMQFEREAKIYGAKLDAQRG